MSDITACLSTGKDDWETPDDLFSTYNSLFAFVLDAAANASNAKLPNWFGPGSPLAEDALSADWGPWLVKGNIWLNPPYSKGLQGKFVRKACAETSKQPVGQHNHVVCLLPSRTDTKLFHEVILPHGEVTFLKGRVKFKGASQGAPFPSMIVVF